jgi:hypothetical protein
MQKNKDIFKLWQILLVVFWYQLEVRHQRVPSGSLDSSGVKRTTVNGKRTTGGITPSIKYLTSDIASVVMGNIVS